MGLPDNHGKYGAWQARHPERAASSHLPNNFARFMHFARRSRLMNVKFVTKNSDGFHIHEPK